MKLNHKPIKHLHGAFFTPEYLQMLLILYVDIYNMGKSNDKKNNRMAQKAIGGKA